MEKFIYTSIVFFTAVILTLYVYLLFEKILEAIKNKIRDANEDEVFKLIDEIVLKLEGENLKDEDVIKIKDIIKSRIKRELVEERLIYYFMIYSGDIIKRLTKLVEKVGLVDFEIQNLNSDNLYTVSLAARRLGEFRSKKAIEPLLKALDINSNDVKYNVLLALSKIGDEDAFIKAFEKLEDKILLSERSLIEIIDDFEGDKVKVYKTMFNSKNSFLASIFMKSAANYMDVSLSDIVANFLRDPNKEKRIAAIKFIGNLSDARYIDDIIERLQDEEWEVRAVAAKVLERFQDERAVMPLVKALSDKVWFVRYNAASSLIKIPKGIDAIDLVMQGNDRFAKDIILYAAQNIELLEVTEDDREKIKKVIERYKR